MSTSTVAWIIDDDRSIRWVLDRALTQAGLRTRSFDNGDNIMRQLEHEQPDVIISDIRMPGIDGLSLLARITESHPGLPVIIMTAHSDLESAVSSYQTGAFDYLPKPFDLDDAVALVRRAAGHSRERRAKTDSVHDKAADSAEIIGEAPAMQEVFRAIGRLSHSNITVLINGESGTGKELVAQALHNHSPQTARPACCEYWPTVNSTGWVAPQRSRWMCALLPPLIKTWKPWCRPAAFAKTCSTA